MNYKETIESLRCCFGFGVCSDCKAKNMTEEDPLPCKLNCKERLGLHAADLIERLTAENAALPDGQVSAIESLLKEIEWKDMVISLAQRKQADAEAERDAALADLADARSCKNCKYACDTRDCSSCKSKTCKCRECHLDKNAWEWRGAPDAPEEGGKA